MTDRETALALARDFDLGETILSDRDRDVLYYFAVWAMERLRVPTSVVVVDASWSWNDTHDVQPKPHGLAGRWCTRCGISETTTSLEGMKCMPLYAGQKPYGGRPAIATVQASRGEGT